jgi:hypothetical protein
MHFLLRQPKTAVTAKIVIVLTPPIVGVFQIKAVLVRIVLVAAGVSNIKIKSKELPIL